MEKCVRRDYPCNFFRQSNICQCGGMWIREGHRCPNLKALCFSILLDFSNVPQGCFCGVFLGHGLVIGEMLCPLLPRKANLLTPTEFGA